MGTQPHSDDEDDVDVLPIPLDRETRRRLKVFAAKVGKREIEAAEELLVDLLFDDDFWNEAKDAATPPGPQSERTDHGEGGRRRH